MLNKQKKQTYKYNKNTTYGKQRLSQGEKREGKIKNKPEMNELKRCCFGQDGIWNKLQNEKENWQNNDNQKDSW